MLVEIVFEEVDVVAHKEAVRLLVVEAIVFG